MPSNNYIPPEDLRETLFRKYCKDYVLDLEGAKQVMEEYAKQIALEFYYDEESVPPEKMELKYQRFIEKLKNNV